MTELEKGLIILDGSFDIDYKYKRELVDGIDKINSLTEFASLALSFFKSKIQEFDEKLFKSKFTDSEYNKLIAKYDSKKVKVITEFSSIYPEELKEVRTLCPELPFLVPGVGAQGGDVEKVVKNGTTGLGTGLIINSSRGIIYASKDADFGTKAGEKTIELRDLINSYR